MKEWVEEMEKLEDVAIAVVMVLGFSCMAAWITHVVWGVNKLMSDAGATAGQIVLLLFGTFVPPIGVIHGLIIWFS